ncbi:MAG TPA: efflux RND transporter periplasmic adaptor subunit [Polyangia bacterium]|jgi:cobalt-zinc-cadmium efflux system membrane fusion protein|nr:efflux RND transporter periplasmic adaptor subunit [Polyangia bacterium]
MRNRSTVTVLAACLLAAACSKGHEEGGDKSEGAGEGAHDFVRFNPGSAPLDFIKLEAVAETAGATSVTLPGRVTFDEDHTQRVASPIDGRAVSILAKLGDKVRAGQPLIELSSPNVGQLQADAQKAMSDLSLAEKATERVHKLQAEGAVADKDVAQAENDLRKAKSDSGRTTAQLKSLGVSATDPAVAVALRAQIPGVVVERNVLVGQEVRADQAAPLVTITSLDTVWVQADAYEQDLSLVAEGDAVTIRVPAYPAESFPGKVGHIGEVVDAASRTVKIRCLVDNKSRKLKPEMFAKVDVLNAAGHKLILVPAQAVLNDGDKSVVIVASEGNVFRSRRVEVGPETDGKVRVLTGLHAGEKIVTDGAIFMKREIDTQ